MNLNSLLATGIVKIKGRNALALHLAASRNLRASQEKLLLEILKSSGKTRYGVNFNFSEIESIKDFQEKVPVQNYEDLRSYIEAEEEGELGAILSEESLFYAVTSGTTGKPKYIPVHKSALKAHSRSSSMMIAGLLKDRPKLFSGKIWAIVSPAVEGRMKSGKAFGATSGHIYKNLPRIVKGGYLLNSAVFEIADYDLKYLVMLRIALAQENITYISTANPSTIAKLKQALIDNWDLLISDIEIGTFSFVDRIPAEILEKIKEDLSRKNPERAGQLRALRKTLGRDLRFAEIWPNIQALGTWTGGSCKIFVDKIRPEFDSHTLIRDLGYLSSEFRGTVHVEGAVRGGMPTFLDTFFEFVEESEIDLESKSFLTLDQLEVGKKYYVYITTTYGLYRYDMNDVIEVTEIWNGIPFMVFVQKGKGVTSITGEKLYENQVISAVKAVEKELDLHSNFFIVECDPENASYTLHYEALAGFCASDNLARLAKWVDLKLGEINVEYQAKRASGRVKELKVNLLRSGAYEKFKKSKVESGQREGQFKIVALQYKKDLAYNFERNL